MNHLEPLAIQQYIKRSADKSLISFAAGLPSLSVLPLTQLKKAYHNIENLADKYFQYNAPSNELKQKIQQLMLKQGLPCRLDEILITNGAQQGIALACHLYLKHQQTLWIEEFVYPGFLHTAKQYQINYQTIPSIYGEGLDLDALESILQSGVKLPFLYLVANGNNPQSYTLDENKRKRLANLADTYDFIIVEDDPYCYLKFSATHYRPMRTYTKKALYIGTFSKTISPSVRTGWIIGDKETINHFEHIKDRDDLYLFNPNQAAVNTVLSHCQFDEIINPQLELYQSKMDCMVSSIEQTFDFPYQLFIPEHGMFLWVEFPETDIESNVSQVVDESKVLFIPGSAFAPNKTHRQAMRLGFTYPSHETIKNGIKQLGQSLNRLNLRFSSPMMGSYGK